MIHKLYTTTASDAAITWIAPEDTVITHVKYILLTTAPIDGGTSRVELSFAAANQFTGNDVTNVIDQVTRQFEAGAAGTTPCDLVWFQELPGGVSIEAGEKLYVHTSTSASSMAVAVFIYTTARRTNKSSFRRRS